MYLKRKEGFRFVFNQPIDARFKLLVSGQAIEAIGSCPAQILDISPRGAKMFSEVKFGEYIHSSTLQVELQFVLDVTTIQAIGEVVWSKPFGKGYQYGVQFQAQENIDELIISEMKKRRKKEVLQSKQTR